MAFGSISQSLEREMAVDFTYPYDSTATGIVSKKPGPITSFTSLLRPFQPLLWAVIAIAFVTFVPTYWACSYNVQQNTRISMGRALLQSYQCLLMRGKTHGLDLWVNVGFHWSS